MSKSSARKIPTAVIHQLTNKTNPLEAISPEELASRDEKYTSLRRLRVVDVQQFAQNPRSKSNEKFEEIRDSIKNGGLESMIAVCRHPGKDAWVTAKGGGTRLSALQELAKHEDPEIAKRFEYADFQEVTYVSDAALLAAHLIENIQRADMCFWDTARGVMDLKAELAKELGQDLGSREAVDAMKKRGLASITDTTMLQYQFAVKTYGQMPEAFRFDLTRDDVRNVLRPQHGLLLDLWLKHEGRKEATFAPAYAEWLSMASEQCRTASLLHSHLIAMAATEFGYSSDQLELMLAALKLDRTAALSDLLGNGPPDAGGGGGAGDTPPADLPDSDAGADGNQSPAAASQTPLTPAAFRESSPTGLRVASGLVPKTFTGAPANPSDGASDDEDDGPSGHQPAFDGMGVEDIDQQQLMHMLIGVAAVVAIDSYIRPAPALPYGFFMELPAPGVLGSAPEDLAVQGWWLLANLSGQFENDIDAFLERVDVSGAPILPDTGPDGYRAAVSDPELWPTVVAESLGGETLIDAQFVLRVLCDPHHPLSMGLSGLLEAMRAFNAAQGAK
ncbi:MAG: hypothetical protein KA795_06000 [Burkholderiaceae bacterium]|nr:hypothetical protein [Burkholderiaceae bacterium]